ncbi:unnamed protein product [Dicrocoelium dendriticum]|nr:unnamed protein product [Dicrocoelium dendriticum]
MFGVQLVRKVPCKPPKVHVFRDVTQGESTSPTTEEAIPHGLKLENYVRHLNACMEKPRTLLGPEAYMETVHAHAALKKLHVTKRRDLLRPKLALEEACLNEELRERFGRVVNCS